MSSHNIDSSGATFEDLAIDDTLTDLERVVRYVHSNIALQRVIHVRMLEETAVAAGSVLPRQIPHVAAYPALYDSFEKTVEAIVPVLEPLVSDAEFVVRQHLAGQFPGLCKHLVESGGDVGYKLVLDKMFCVPEFISLAGDPVFRVRKAIALNCVQVCTIAGPVVTE
ncbi:hypothetical protein AaE_001246, partial [Aphanomyces astaci]